MQQEKDSKNVYAVTKAIISSIEAMSDEGAQKAILAKLRNSIGRSISESIDVLALMFSRMPNELLGREGVLSCEEDAVLTALQMYALHKQGNRDSVMLDTEEKEGEAQKKIKEGFGSSLSYLRKKEDSKAEDRRFNAMITSNDLEELKNHLRHFIKLLKSRDKTVKVDYALLAKDLYFVGIGHLDYVRLNWARDYYKINERGEEKNEE